jgi:phosphoribosylformylglycinamidine synthase
MWQAEVYVTFKRGVLDPQGEAIRSSLVALGFASVGEVRTGKFMQVRLEAPTQAEAAARVEEMCRRLLANTVIEDYRYEVSAL